MNESRKDNDTIHKKRTKNTNLMGMLFSLIVLKHPPTSDHSESVSRYATIIAKALNLPGDQIDKVKQAGLLHDIGKIMVDNCVLNKKKPLTERDFLQIRSHSEKGMRILTQFKMNNYIIDAAWHHHERWDGEGYPDGIQGESISLITRIVCIADALDAMADDRPYRKHLSDEEIIKQIEEGKGSQFDPDIADVVIKLIKEKRLN